MAIQNERPLSPLHPSTSAPRIRWRNPETPSTASPTLET